MEKALHPHLVEIDCNELIWNYLTNIAFNGWGNVSNALGFAYSVPARSKINADDIDSALWDKYPMADDVEVTELKYSEMKHDEAEKGKKYFAAKVIIYNSDI